MENQVLTYRNISFQDLEEIVNIEKRDNDTKFDNWLSYKYKISENEEDLLKKLIRKNKLYLSGYNEAKLTFKFISPLLNRVDFDTGEIKDWYESNLTGVVNGRKFSGKTDFMVAKGKFKPKKPFFFVQEFKRSTPNNNPEFQLLAEMIVAMEINKTNIIHGSFVIGKNWHFVVLEKLKNESLEYFVSKQFNCLDIEDLRQIYINLQAAKTLFCKD